MEKRLIILIMLLCCQSFMFAQKIDSLSNRSFQMYSLKFNTKYPNHINNAIMINYGDHNVYFVDKEIKTFLIDSLCENSNLTSCFDTTLFIHNYISRFFNDTSKLIKFHTKILKYKNKLPIKAYYRCDLFILGNKWSVDFIKNENDIVYMCIFIQNKNILTNYSSLDLKYVKCKVKLKRSFWDLFFHVFFGY